MIVGGVLSLTVMICVHVAELPQASVALYVRKIVYLFVQVWLLITSLIQVTVAVPQLSLALPPAKV